MGILSNMFGGKKKFPIKLDGGEDLESLEITGINGQSVSLALAFNRHSLKARPAPNTDIVFAIDASASMSAMYRDGQLESAVWSILEYVLEYDDDGIDFFLHSAANSDLSLMRMVIHRLQAGTATLADIKSALAVKELGQIADRKQLHQALQLQDVEFGPGTMCAPAFLAAQHKRKPDGNLFIELVTDGSFMDNEDVIRQIVAMSREAHAAKKPNMYRIHILGIGEAVDEAFLKTLDEGLSAVAPLDIVAFDLARDIRESPGAVFKELERGFLTVGTNGTVELKGVRPRKITHRYTGISDPELLALERVPQSLELDIEFASLPKAFGVQVTFEDTDGDQFQVSSNIQL